MAVEYVQALPRPQIPHSNLAVVGSRDEPRATTALEDIEDEGGDDSSVSLEDVRAMRASRVPDLDNAVRRAGCEESAGGVGGTSDDGGFVGFGNGAVQLEGRERVDLEGEGTGTGEEETSSRRRGR